MSLTIRTPLGFWAALVLLGIAAACTPTTSPSPEPAADTPTVELPTVTPADTPVLVPFPTALPPTATLLPETPTPSPAATGSRPFPAAPVVQVIAPANNLQVSVNQTVFVVAAAAGENGIVRVDLSADGVPIHSEAPSVPVPSFPAIMPWTPTQLGNHLLRIVASDTNNLVSAPEEVTVTVIPDGRRPVSVILFPIGTPQVELGNVLQVQAAATDETGIVQLDLWVDNVLYTYVTPQGAHSLPTFSTTFAWMSSGLGLHNLVVRAHDTQEQTTDSAPLKVFVVDTHAPVLSVTLDRTSTLAGEPITVTIAAVDIGGIQRVELWTGREISGTFPSSNPSRQTYMTVQFPWQSGNPGDYQLAARAYNANGSMREYPAQTVSVLRPGQPTPTRPPGPTPTRTRTPRATPTPSLQPPAGPSAEIVQPADHFANLWPVRVVFAGRGNTELDRIELWGYYAGQLNPQLICSAEAHATTQKAAQCDWSPPDAGTVFLYAQAVDIYGQVGRSAPISGYVGVPGPPTITPTPASLAGRWSATTQTGVYVLTLRPVGTAIRGDFKVVGANLSGGEVSGRIPYGQIKGDRVTFHVDFAPVPLATSTPSPDSPTVAPPTNASAPLPALDFDCGVDPAGAMLDCKTKDSRGQSGAAQFRRQ
jgi:hypothetical protein